MKLSSSVNAKNTEFRDYTNKPVMVLNQSEVKNQYDLKKQRSHVSDMSCNIEIELTPQPATITSIFDHRLNTFLNQI